MKNLLAEAMARVIVEGLTAHSAQIEKLTRELEVAIIQAAQASGKPVTIETMFAGQDLNGPAFADLRKTLRNPGLKPEATISELRRAEATSYERTTNISPNIPTIGRTPCVGRSSGLRSHDSSMMR